MTALTRNPNNPNPLQPNKFLLTFGRAPNVQYFCQNVTVPGISLGEAVITNPFVDLYSPGEKAIYDLLNITFIIDEELRGWLEVHDWIRAMTFPVKFEEYQKLPSLNKYQSAKNDISKKFPQFSDATVTLLSSAFKPNLVFRFHDVFPVSISSFIMNALDDSNSPITADATFRYTYYDVEKIT
jgi:hypothetical protein